MKTFGIILIVVGILMLVVTNINFKTEENVVDLGPLQVNKEKDHHIGWPTYAGALVLVGGVVVTAIGAKKGAKH